MRVGLGISEDLPVVEQQGLAREVERAGLASLWTNEARGRDALQLCTAWALATDELDVGVGVLPIWTRSVAQLAMGVATLQEASGGRLLLGLGVSHPATMDPWHDAGYERPLTAARETLEVLDGLLAGGTSDLDGEVVRSHRFGLQISPLPPRPRIYLAAMGPRMLALAGTAADGTLLNWSSPDTITRSAAAVRSAAARAGDGRTPAAVEIAAYVRFAVDDDADAARRALAREVSRYCALPAYAEHFTRQGYGEAVEAIEDAYRDGGGDAAAAAVPEGMLHGVGWYGTPDDAPTDVLARYASTGLDHLVARVVVVGDDPVASVRATVAALAHPPFASS